MADYNKGGGFNLKEENGEDVDKNRDSDIIEGYQRSPLLPNNQKHNLYEIQDEQSRNESKSNRILAPIKFIQQKFANGSINASVFSTIQVTLGAGILTFPYAIMENGVIWGSILIFFGGLVSWYIAMLLIQASEHCGRVRYEDIALVMYGRKFAIVTAILNLVTLLGFNMSYIVYMQTAMPDILKVFIGKDKIPAFMADTDWGHRFWGAFFSFIILLPMSIPRQVNSLRYFSAMGVVCGVYLSLTLFFMFWFDREVVSSPVENLKNGQLFIFTTNGVFSTVPLITFAFMYQLNIPGIYGELRDKNYSRMNSVTIRATTAACIIYLIAGLFGYYMFVNDLSQLKTKNILDADFKGSVAITIALITQFFSIMTSYPLILLPCKDTIEELFWKESTISFIHHEGEQRVKDKKMYRMSNKANFFVTLFCVTVPFALSLLLSSLGDALTVIGSTTNPLTGFIIPILFYWKVFPDKSVFSREKLLSFIAAVIIVIISIIGLLNFFLFKEK